MGESSIHIFLIFHIHRDVVMTFRTPYKLPILHYIRPQIVIGSQNVPTIFPSFSPNLPRIFPWFSRWFSWFSIDFPAFFPWMFNMFHVFPPQNAQRIPKRRPPGAVQVGAAVAAHDQNVLPQHRRSRREARRGQLGARQPALRGGPSFFAVSSTQKIGSTSKKNATEVWWNN